MVEERSLFHGVLRRVRAVLTLALSMSACAVGCGEPAETEVLEVQLSTQGARAEVGGFAFEGLILLHVRSDGGAQEVVSERGSRRAGTAYATLSNTELVATVASEEAVSSAMSAGAPAASQRRISFREVSGGVGNDGIVAIPPDALSLYVTPSVGSGTRVRVESPLVEEIRNAATADATTRLVPATWASTVEEIRGAATADGIVAALRCTRQRLAGLDNNCVWIATQTF